MKRLIEIRKALDISQTRVAEYLKIKSDTYAKMEKRGFKTKIEKQVIMFFIMECNNGSGSREELKISQKRLSALLGMHVSNLHKYKGDVKKVLERDRERRMFFKTELHEMLK